MRIGFLLQRSTYLKNFSGLIDASIAKGHEAVLLFELKQTGGNKNYQNVTMEDVKPFEGRARLEGVDMKQIARFGRLYGIDALFLLESYNSLIVMDLLDDLGRLRANGVLALNLSYFFETCHLPLESLNAYDRTYFLSDYARNLFFKLNEPLNSKTMEWRQGYEHLTAALGSPLYEQIRKAREMNARREFGIPDNARVVLVASPPLRPDMPWRWIVWRHPDRRTRVKRAISSRQWKLGWEAIRSKSFKQCIDALKEFCDRNDALLVVKSRSKQDDPSYLIDAADIYLDGHLDKYYPVFTTYKLLSIADLVVFNQSMIATEALVAGVPSLGMYVPHREFISNANRIQKLFLDTISGGEPDSVLNYPGCVTLVDHSKFPDWIKSKRIIDFRIDETRRKTYMEYFLGETDEPSSIRILSDLESLNLETVSSRAEKLATRPE